MIFLKSAEGEYAAAQDYIGYCYYNGVRTDKDNDKAIEWYKKALDNGVENKLDNILLGNHD